MANYDAYQRTKGKPVARPRSASGAGRAAAGTPAYKSQEEYYDDILNLKKEIKSLKETNKKLQAKLGRVEKDNLKKERDIEQLLDPGKSTEMRRTLADRKPDMGTVIHGLKQRILKLEQQLRDKESKCNKIESDLKYTRVDELRTQLETAYNEIERLKSTSQPDALNRSTPRSARPTERSKVQALNEVIKRLNDERKQLKDQNRKLVNDLDTQMIANEQRGDVSAREKSQARQIAQLQQKLEASELKVRELKNNSSRDKSSALNEMKYRVEELEQVDHQRVEELARMKDRLHHSSSQNKQLRKDKDALRSEIEALRRELEEARNKPVTPPRATEPRRSSGLRATRPRPDDPPARREQAPVAAARQPRPDSARSTASDRDRRDKAERFRENRAASQIQKGWRQHHSHKQALQSERVEEFRQNRAAKKIQKGWRSTQDKKQVEAARIEEHERRMTQAEHLRENHAARRIQRGWKDNRLDDASETIQGTLRAHMKRRQQADILRIDEDRPVATGTGSDDEYIEQIQATFRGHQSRRRTARPTLADSNKEDDYNDAVEEIQAAFKAHHTRLKHKPLRDRTNFGEPDSSQLKSWNNGSRRGSNTSSKASSRMRTPVSLTEETDDDGDIVF